MLIAEQIFNEAGSVSEARELATLFSPIPPVMGWYTFEDHSQLYIGKDWTSKVCVEARNGTGTIFFGRWYPENGR